MVVMTLILMFVTATCNTVAATFCCYCAVVATVGVVAAAFVGELAPGCKAAGSTRVGSEEARAAIREFLARRHVEWGSREGLVAIP